MSLEERELRWSFFMFDWERFQEVKPLLQEATRTGAFDELSIPNIAETLRSLDGDAPRSMIANALVADLCGVGDWVSFPKGLHEMISILRRKNNGEDLADELGKLLSEENGVEWWFHADEGISNIFTPQRTQCLSAYFRAIPHLKSSKESPSGLALLTRRLLQGESVENQYRILNDMFQDCAENGYGIAVWKEN